MEIKIHEDFFKYYYNMANKFYTTSTSALKATSADIRKLNVKSINTEQITVNGNAIPLTILDDRREFATDQDLWGTSATTDENGKVRISHKRVTNPKANNSKAWNTNITSVRNNEAYIDGDKYCNIQTDMIKNGKYMFRNCTNLTSFDSDLSNLDYGYYMFTGTGITKFSSDLSSLSHANNMFSNSEITYFGSTLHNLTEAGQMFYNTPLATFIGDLSSLVDANGMFYNTLLTTFFVNLSSLTSASDMFAYCSALIDFESDLGNLINGERMFQHAVNLAEFKGNLSNLINGASMFYNTSIASFDSNLSNLIYGNSMFYNTPIASFDNNLSNLVSGRLMFSKCKNITSFNINLSNLVDGSGMFNNSGLVTFVSNLSNLSNGSNMFYNSKLTTFIGDLSSLVDGLYMFAKCKLNSQSVLHIADSLPSVSSGNITLGIDVVNNSSTLEQQLQTFAKNATFDSWEELKQTFIDKGWTVTFQYGGTTTNITLSEDEEFRGTPIYARLIEVQPASEEYTEEEKASAEYCTEDGTKYYNIDWGHDVTHPDEFQYFGSLLEACGYYGIIPKKYLEES